MSHAVESAFVAPERGARARTAAATAAALISHGVLVALAMNHHPPARALVTTTEVELLPPPAPLVSTPAPPPVEPAPLKPVVARAARAPRAPARPVAPESPPPPAAAAPLRLAEESAKVSSEPVRFVSDPSGASFGYGTVARGGSGAGRGGTGPQHESAPTRRDPQPGSLSRPPRLEEREPCRGFFPASARVDRGEVALKVRVEADGRVRSLTVEREEPLGQGFGFAARDCLRSKRFLPALDRAGQAVAVTAPISVRFSR